jgi:hypothetical protein
VSITDANNLPITGYTNITLTPTSPTTSLSGIPYANNTTVLNVVLVFAGTTQTTTSWVSSPPPTFNVTWSGPPVQPLCYKTKVPLELCAANSLSSVSVVTSAVLQDLTGTANLGPITSSFDYQAGGSCAPSQGILKICKVAGPGVAVNTNYTFGGFGPNVVIPAGPAPGGFCKIAGNFPIGANIPVNETLPSDTSVTIAVNPPSQLVGTPNLVTGSVLIAIGPGVTEVTFTNRRTGFIEICKQSTGSPAVTGTFDFTVGGQTYTIPVGVCTGPIELPLGANTITESFKVNTAVSGCTAVPSPLTSCNPVSGSAVVNVVPGGIAAQEIVTFTNRNTGPGAGGGCAPACPRTTQASTMCSPNPAVVRQVVSCAVAVTDTTPNPKTPTGLVMCSDGAATHVIGSGVLDSHGQARFRLRLGSVGSHLITCTYQGGAAFASATAPTIAEVITGR